MSLAAYRTKAAKALSDIILDWEDIPAPVSDGKVDDLLRELAGLPERPENRKPYEGLFKLPEKKGMVAKATFSMELGPGALKEGRLIFTDAEGNSLLNVVATAGAMGYQESKYFWTRGVGPIPPGPDYQIDCEAYWAPETPGVNGWWHYILPRTVKGPSGQTRSAFGLHWDSNHRAAPGSAGCVVILNKQSMAEASALLKAARSLTSTIPLELNYTGK